MNLQATLLLALLLAYRTEANAQLHLSAQEIPCTAGPGITATPLHRDERCSAMLLCIPNEVQAHLHRHHTEHVSILQGHALLLLGSDTIRVSAGDVVAIPAGTPHAVIRTMDGPLKVLSVHSPPFDGVDRIPWEP